MVSDGGTATVRVPPPLQVHLSARHRRGAVDVALDGTSSLLHVVESLGVPRTEIGGLVAGGSTVPGGYRPLDGDVVDVLPVQRPRRLPAERFLLDVHLGTLARRMRLLGLDTAYRNEADDADLVRQAVEEGRVLLTRDRGLLRRRALPLGAYVSGDRPDDQLVDVLDRFAPRLAAWTRCSACNGSLLPASAHAVGPLVQPGTRRSYQRFADCADCGKVYWRGAHAERLQAIVESALRGQPDRDGPLAH